MQQYATFDDYPQFSYSILKHLLASPDAELLWKILKYNTNNPYKEVNLTKSEKTALIYDGSADPVNFRVFLDQGMEDVVTEVMTLIRIYPLIIMPENYTNGLASINFEIYSHHKTNTMINKQTKIDTIVQILLKSLNGKDIGGVGNLFFNANRSRYDKIAAIGTTPYKGKCLTMSVNIA